jgi:hypothetical protein
MNLNLQQIFNQLLKFMVKEQDNRLPYDWAKGDKYASVGEVRTSCQRSQGCSAIPLPWGLRKQAAVVTTNDAFQ